MIQFSEDELTTAMNAIYSVKEEAITATNDFCQERILTRGGRVGSGMGTLLEALWGFNMNQLLSDNPNLDYEIAWFPDNDYNDFACIKRDSTWVPRTRRGELFRVEIKSMNREADESKGHFDEIIQNLGDFDLLVVLIWSWCSIDGIRAFPYIQDFFMGNAKEIAYLRDTLHCLRGGSFVDASYCPDGCNTCTHHGEPLNSQGNRERKSGPLSRKPRGSSHASNFGGLVRMLKTSNDNMRTAFREIRAESNTAHDYITFIHRNYPNEEYAQYKASEWKQLAESLGLDLENYNKDETVQIIRETAADYQEYLRDLY